MYLNISLGQITIFFKFIYLNIHGMFKYILENLLVEGSQHVNSRRLPFTSVIKQSVLN